MERGILAHGRYRYRLWRRWQPGTASLLWVMLNPSTADEVVDDPTIRRCIGLARGWGFGAIEVVNLYGLRATRPAALFRARDPVGPGNDAAIAACASSADAVALAWGAHGVGPRRDVVLGLLAGRRLFCLGSTRRGEPRHPLYVPATVRPRAWHTAFAAP